MSQSLLLWSHLPLSPWSYVTPFTYVYSSDFAQCVFENFKLFVFLTFFPQILKLTVTFCVDHGLHSSTQVFSHEFSQLIFHALTDSMKFPLKDNIDPETFTSSRPDCLGKY